MWADTVVDGEVIARVPVFRDEVPRGSETTNGKTMELLFDEIERIVADGFARLDLEFDPKTGAVVRYSVDVDTLVIDEEFGLSVLYVGPLDGDPALTELNSNTLSADYGCAWGFAVGSPSQELALMIHFGNYPGPDIEGPFVLPSDGWVAELRVGSDLFSNWCDDIIEENEPTPVIDRRLTIISGLLTIDTRDGTTTWDGTHVTATLTGAAVQSLDGTVVDIGDLDLHNACWGCFAG